MSSIDDLFSAAIAEGNLELEKKKLEKKNKKPSIQERRETASKLLTQVVEHQVYTVYKGQFEITCLVAEYVRRTCQTCKHSELSSVPRVFLCEQDVKQPGTRRLHRLTKQENARSYIQQGLPVKTEVYTSPAPFCKHCVREVIDYAQRQTREGYSPDPALYSESPVLGAVSGLPGDVRGATPAYLQAWGLGPVSNPADHPGPEREEGVKFLPIVWEAPRNI